MIGMGKGMVATFKHIFQRPITLQYPYEKRQLPERSRMSFAMRTDEEGVAVCSSCMLCARSCPDEAIVIESEKKPEGSGRVLTKFTIDLGRCMYCGLCVEQCTTHGLMHTGDYEFAVPTRAETMLVIYDLPAEKRVVAPTLGEGTDTCDVAPVAEGKGDS